MIDRYRYPPQECEIRVGNELKTRDEKKFGEVARCRPVNGRSTEERKSVLDVHPASVFAHEHVVAGDRQQRCSGW